MLFTWFLIAAVLLPPNQAGAFTDLSRLASKTPVIVVGKIIDIGEPPIIWSGGGLLVTQKVKYKLVAVLKGENIAEEVTVRHYIFKGSPNSDKDRPRLSPAVFTLGSEHILFLRPADLDSAATPPSNAIEVFSETNTARGAVPAHENNLREVKNALRLADAPPRSGP